MANVPTPHISAQLGDFAETVLMPGDPLRSKFIAENFLEDAVLVNNIRGVQGYTGTYKGKRVSVMASGMGMPAIGIYAHELFNFYDVKNIIRVGTAGGLTTDVKVRDVVMGQAAVTNSNWAAQYGTGDVKIPAIASFELLKKAEAAAKEIGVNPNIGLIFSSDVFYDGNTNYDKLRELGVMATEMESAALYMEATKAGKNALCICTISDHLVTGEVTTPEERQNTFTTMMKIALETAIAE